MAGLMYYGTTTATSSYGGGGGSGYTYVDYSNGDISATSANGSGGDGGIFISKTYCDWCGSEYHSDKFHKGTCGNCGAPKGW